MDARKYNRDYKKRSDWHSERIEKWRELVEDKAMERELIYFISDPANYGKVWEEVHDAYLQMPSHKLLSMIPIHHTMVKETRSKKKIENIVTYCRKEALDIMLARRGKVRSVNTLPEWQIEYFEPALEKDSRQVWDMRLDIWVYIKDELQRHGVPARLIFKNPFIQDFEQTPYDVNDVEKFHYNGGELVWLHTTYYDDNLNYIKV